MNRPVAGLVFVVMPVIVRIFLFFGWWLVVTVTTVIMRSFDWCFVMRGCRWGCLTMPMTGGSTCVIISMPMAGCIGVSLVVALTFGSG